MTATLFANICYMAGSMLFFVGTAVNVWWPK